eukprot:TRINITY_DN4653_c0_g2_i1.p1 TRINITY_DN4653_c0_g2~~TRINITY_DN4653_c0_g2_i1.p1  ORF type:complete len:362 (+),score=44.19 TRINITY_DN4653_c0_g2_i1:34-1119(+)
MELPDVHPFKIDYLSPMIMEPLNNSSTNSTVASPQKSTINEEELLEATSHYETARSLFSKQPLKALKLLLGAAKILAKHQHVKKAADAFQLMVSLCNNQTVQEAHPASVRTMILHRSHSTLARIYWAHDKDISVQHFSSAIYCLIPANMCQQAWQDIHFSNLLQACSNLYDTFCKDFFATLEKDKGKEHAASIAQQFIDSAMEACSFICCDEATTMGIFFSTMAYIMKKRSDPSCQFSKPLQWNVALYHDLRTPWWAIDCRMYMIRNDLLRNRIEPEIFELLQDALESNDVVRWRKMGPLIQEWDHTSQRIEVMIELLVANERQHLSMVEDTQYRWSSILQSDVQLRQMVTDTKLRLLPTH